MQKILGNISDDNIRFPKDVVSGYSFKDPEIASQNKVLLKTLYYLYEKNNSVKPNKDDFKIFDNIMNKLDNKDVMRVSLLISQIFGMQANQSKDDSKNSHFMDIHSLAHMFFYKNKNFYEPEYQGFEFELFYFFFQKYLELSKVENQEIANKKFNEFINIDTNSKDLLQKLGFKDYIKNKIDNCPDQFVKYKEKLKILYASTDKISDIYLENLDVTLE